MLTKRGLLAGVAIQTLIPKKYFFFEAMRDERGERSLKIWLNKLMISISTSLSTSRERAQSMIVGPNFCFLSNEIHCSSSSRLSCLEMCRESVLQNGNGFSSICSTLSHEMFAERTSCFLLINRIM